MKPTTPAPIFANVPDAGMAWMHCQYLVGLARLGHEVSYVETTSAWPYHPVDMTTTDDPGYSLAYLQRVMQGFGLGDRWAYRTAYSDGAWHGPLAGEAVELIRSADAVLNITGSTTPEEIGDRVRRATGERATSIESIEVLAETPCSALPRAARERLGIMPDQKNVLLKLVMRDHERTLTSAEANLLRDAVYAALHEGTAHSWAAR